MIRCALRGEAKTRRPGVVGALAGERDGDRGEEAGDEEPVGDGPEQRGHEMPVAVHVRVSVGRRVAEEVEGILQPEVKKNGSEDENADDDTVADELVGDDGLQKKREQGEDEHLGEGDHIELFGVLHELIVVIAGDGLHENATETGNRKQDELDET